MTGGPRGVDALYRARKGRVEFIDVPPMQYLVTTGDGELHGPDFTRAADELSTVGCGVRSVLKAERDLVTKSMPLEALWWADEPPQQDLVAAVALGVTDVAAEPRWHWQVMIMQPEAIGESTVALAVEHARQKDRPTPAEVRIELWTEGPAAQTLHVGPYADEEPTMALLLAAIEAAGLQPRGRRHEIYLSDPRRRAPERLRTILRHPVEPT